MGKPVRYPAATPVLRARLCRAIYSKNHATDPIVAGKHEAMAHGLAIAIQIIGQSDEPSAPGVYGEVGLPSDAIWETRHWLEAAADSVMGERKAKKR